MAEARASSTLRMKTQRAASTEYNAQIALPDYLAVLIAGF